MKSKLQIHKSLLILYVIFTFVFIWCQQLLSVNVAGGNLRFGFILLLLLVFLANIKLNTKFLSLVIIFIILGLASSFSLVSWRPIFYIFLFLGNAFISIYLYQLFIRSDLHKLEIVCRWHLLTLILLLVCEALITDGRLHLGFKEPSYLGIYLSVFVGVAILMRNFQTLFYATIAGALSLSMFSVVTLAFGWSLFYLRFLRNPRVVRQKKVLISASLPFFVFGFAIFLLENRLTRSFVNLFTELSFENVLQYLLIRGGSRVDRMFSALEYGAHNVLVFFGVGPGNFVYVNNPISNPTYEQINTEQGGFSGPATNVFIEFGVEFGLVALLILVATILYNNRRLPWVALLPLFLCISFESSYLRPSLWFGATLLIAMNFNLKKRVSL